MQEIIPCGLDFGNSWVKLCLLGKVAKVPQAYSLNKKPSPQMLPNGLEANKLKAFPLLIGKSLVWFGQDVLSKPVIREMDDTKYNPEHITILFRAILYHWGITHNVDLATLGKLNIVASMPPGAYADRAKNSQAVKAYKKAFTRGKSHLQIRGPTKTSQVVTRFGGLQREAVSTVGAVSRAKTLTLIIDLGYGTNDYALFNGGSEPIFAKTDNGGLAYAYEEINPVNPAMAELAVLNNKKNLPSEILTHFSQIKNRVVMLRRKLPQDIEKIVMVGGGAALMTAPIKADFSRLAKRVVVKDEYENARANWRAAGGE